jgi:integrin beta 3
MTASQLKIDHTADVLWSLFKSYVDTSKAPTDLIIKQQALQIQEMKGELVSLREMIAAIPIAKDGVDGLNGKDGADGLNGKDGADGLAGRDGADGLNGKDGADGLNGKDGADGAPGRDGAPGKDAEPIDMDLISASVTAWLEANRPKDGESGAPGCAGRDGKDGLDGLHGKDGERGPSGPEGKEGAPGRDGRDGGPGRDGKDGAPGLPGKDGADGLSFKEAIKFESDRQYGFDLVCADGSINELRFDKGTMADTHHGIWKEGNYLKGSVTTYAGSLFLALKDTDGKPEVSPDWKLIVKRGRDGKDGKPGTPGNRGEQGLRGEKGERGFNGL